MTLSFLCPVHRDWVHFHPNEALEKLETTQQRGELLLMNNEWQQAIPFLGCAFESVEILLDLQGDDKSFLFTRLTSLVILLSTCFSKLNQTDASHTLLEQALKRLERAIENCANNPDKQGFLQQCAFAVKENQYLIRKHSIHWPSAKATVH